MFSRSPKAINKHSKHIFVLSCDGAGVRSYISLQVLLVLEEELRMQGSALTLANCFDIFVGTSMGALINTLIQSKHFQTYDLVNLLFKELPKCLHENNNPKSINILGQKVFPKYSSDSLSDWLRSIFGNADFSTLPTETIVPVYDILNIEPYEFSKKTAETVPQHKIMQAALSLPQFFEPVYFQAEEMYTEMEGNIIDGSIYSANPSLHALANITTKDTMVHIFSVGAGIIPLSLRNKNAFSGLIDTSYGLPIMQLIQNSASQKIEHLLNKLDTVDLTSINTHLSSNPDHIVYDWSPAYLDYLHTNAINLVHNNRLKIKNYVQTLLKYKKVNI